MPPPAPLPDTIGRYRIEAILGRGAMGLIYRAHDPAIDRKVAIKLVRADLLDSADRADYIARFQREAQAAGRCAHPNIVAVYDFALHEGNPYLAMEYIDGVTLQQVGQRPSPSSAAEIVSLGGQILDGLGAAHALGVIHRDIKPANIMLTARGRVKVTDFGISRLDTSNLTGTGGVIGTPSYMSPEQCRGSGVDARSDLFSAAVVLYELLTGAKPFTGTSYHEVWHKLLNDDPVDSASLRPDIPRAIHAAIARSLAKDQAARFPTAEAMAVALRDGQAPLDDATLAAFAQKTALDHDRTVMQASPTLGGSGVQVDKSAITLIERGLARHVGPIASYLVRSAVIKSQTMEALADALVASIDDPDGRDQFRRELRGHLAASPAAATTMPSDLKVPSVVFPDAELARVQTALAHFVGPIARVLVKRTVPNCTGVSQLWNRLAETLDEPHRARFLAQL